ncbi:ABC transporter substrate-binding protein [Bacillus sp. Marseille-P3661]|uniref:ABC transporter substrate-binding protein n=1 Tax=Bacillus sp. Marseille-P3661 TaxID=1936234 RepID=UPI000C850F5D|nr:ABC transporter substrate-binding protein [Bacillus sp. Marseille-P3661]
MKKIIMLLLMAVMAIMVSACGAEPELPAAPSNENESTEPESATGDTLAQIKEKGEITIAIDDTFPPMNFRNDKNELTGFDVELAKAVAKELGVEAKFIPTAWDGILPGLDASRYDIIMSTMNVTEERKQMVDFVEYVNLGQIVAVQSGNPLNIKSIEDLTGKVVGVQIGSTSEAAAKEIEGIKEMKTYNAYTDVFNDMGLGRLDAVVVADVVGRYYQNLKPGVFDIAGESFHKLPVGIAVRKDDNELEKALTEAVAKVKENGEFARISNEWFGADLSQQ